MHPHGAKEDHLDHNSNSANPDHEGHHHYEHDHHPHTIGVVTDKVFFDITIDDKPMGRIVFGLFGDDLPRTVDNFTTIAEGTSGVGKLGEDMDYWQTTFHRIIPGFMA